MKAAHLQKSVPLFTYNAQMRKIITVLVFFVVAAIVILSFSEIEGILKTLRHSDGLFMLLALLAQMAWFLNEAAGYRALYRLMDVDEDYIHLILVSTAANFINVVAPSGGIGGVAVFIDDANKREMPRGLAAATAALFLFLEYIAFLCMLGLGIWVLVRRNDLGVAEISASMIMLGIVLGLGFLLYVGSQSGERLGNMLASLSKKINSVLWPLVRKEYFRQAVARDFGLEVASGLSILREKHRGLLIPFAYAVMGKVLQALVLMLTFLSFGVGFTGGTIIAGFATAYLFLIVSPTPSGIGVVEGVLPLALRSLGVAWEEAVVVTLAYRAFTFWLPLLLGAWAFRFLQKNYGSS